MGVGWFSTISAAFLFFTAVTVMFTCRYGEGWREKYNVKQEKRQERKDDVARLRGERKQEEEEEVKP